MKIKILITGLLLIGSVLVSVAKDDNTIEVHDISGIKLLYKPSVKEIISIRLFINGGTANYPKDKQGIENIALMTAINGGTTKRDKIAFQTEAEKIGARFSAGTSYDYGHISMTCLKEYWDSSWNMFQEAILMPAFKPEEFNLLKEQSISAARQAQSDPDAYLRILAQSNAFRGNNYEKIPEGSPESLEKLTLDEVKSYYQNLVLKGNIFIVVVGNVDINELKSKISGSLGTLKKHKVKKSPSKEESSLDIQPLIEKRDIATNYIRGVTNAPAMSNAEGVPMRIAMAILDDRYFVELRTKRSLSYAPAAFYSTGVLKKPYNVVYISTQNPKAALEVMVDEINKIRKDGFQEKELKSKKLRFLTDYYQDLETNSSQSLAIGMAEIADSRHIFENFDQIIESVTLTKINDVFKKYVTLIDWTYLGKDEENLAEVFIQPEI